MKYVIESFQGDDEWKPAATFVNVLWAQRVAELMSQAWIVRLVKDDGEVLWSSEDVSEVMRDVVGDVWSAFQENNGLDD